MRYRSTILEPDGETITQVIEADDEQSLHASLYEDGRTLLRVRSLDRVEAKTAPGRVRLSQRRLLLLTQALFEALDAGVPLLQAFDAIARQEEDDDIAALMRDLGDQVAAGKLLSDALASHPKSFSMVYQALVRAGEQSGSLPATLDSLAGFLEWRIEIASTVRQALVYPMVVGAAGYGMVLFMMAFVIPRLGSVLSKMSDELPAASLILIGCSSFVAANVWTILIGSILGAILFGMLLKTSAVRGFSVSVLGSIPGARGVVQTLSIAQFARTFGVLLNSGLTMTNALHYGGAAVALPSLRLRVNAARERILGGARLAEALEQEEVLPPVAMTMVQVGEDAGRLPITFGRLGKLYDREVKAAVKRALGLLEPIVTVLLGLVVGGIAVLVVTTIYTAMKGVGR